MCLIDKDLATKVCLSDNRRYADLLNAFIFGGRQQIHASDLEESDSLQVRKAAKRKHGRKESAYRQRTRDFIRRTSFGVNFAMIGVENQEQVHYLMPLRTMEYDMAEYEKQADHTKKWQLQAFVSI